MEFQYLKNIKKLESEFISSKRVAIATATIDEYSFFVALNIFNQYESLEIQDTNFETEEKNIPDDNIGTALIEICSNFNNIEKIINDHIVLCENMKNDNSDFLANLTIIKPLFTKLSGINKYFEILKDFEIKQLKNALEQFKRIKDDILNFKNKMPNNISQNDEYNIFKDLNETNEILKEYILTENVKTFTLDYLKTYLSEIKEFIRLIDIYCDSSNNSIYKNLKVNEKLFVYNVLENPILSFAYPLSKVEPKIKIDKKYMNINDFKSNYMNKETTQNDSNFKNIISNHVDNNIELFTTYKITTIKELLIITFIELLKNKIPIRKCKNCNMYFIPKSRSDEVYCNRISPQKSNKTCKEYGSKQFYRDAVKSNHVKKAHYTTGQYFRMKIKRCSSDKEKNKLEKIFDTYKINYEKQKKKYNNNKISEEEFVNWIISQKEI